MHLPCPRRRTAPTSAQRREPADGALRDKLAPLGDLARVSPSLSGRDEPGAMPDLTAAHGGIVQAQASLSPPIGANSWHFVA